MHFKTSSDPHSVQNSVRLQQLIREQMLSAVHLARNASLMTGTDVVTNKYREDALEKIYALLAFVTPHVILAFEGCSDKETDFTTLCDVGLWLGEKTNIKL